MKEATWRREAMCRRTSRLCERAPRNTHISRPRWQVYRAKGRSWSILIVDTAVAGRNRQCRVNPAIAALNIDIISKKGRISYSGFEGCDCSSTASLHPRRSLHRHGRGQDTRQRVGRPHYTGRCGRTDHTALRQGYRSRCKKLGFEVHVIENLTEPVSENFGTPVGR